MERFDTTEFDARVAVCHPDIQAVIRFLQTVGQHAGHDLARPSAEVRGVGVTYWTRGKTPRRFCRIDLRTKKLVVWVEVPGVERGDLARAGNLASRTDGNWLTVTNLVEAVQLVPAILAAYKG